MKKIIITGNVGRDPELRADQNGGEFATFSVGVMVGTKDKPKTDWVDVTCSGKLVDVARNYIKKGSKILVEGFPSVNAYMNRENKAVGTLRIYAGHLELLNRKEDLTSTTESDDNAYILPEVSTNNHSVNTLSSDDIPF